MKRKFIYTYIFNTEIYRGVTERAWHMVSTQDCRLYEFLSRAGPLGFPAQAPESSCLFALSPEPKPLSLPYCLSVLLVLAEPSSGLL